MRRFVGVVFWPSYALLGIAAAVHAVSWGMASLVGAVLIVVLSIVHLTHTEPKQPSSRDRKT